MKSEIRIIVLKMNKTTAKSANDFVKKENTKNSTSKMRLTV